MNSILDPINTRKAKNFLLDHIIEILLIILIIAMWMSSKTFMTLANWLNIFRNISMKGLIAFGMTMVIVAGQIDLSVGSTVAISGVVVARACRDLPSLTGMSVDMACVVGIMIGLFFAVAVGVFHASSQHKFNMPSFIITLASLNLFFGLAGMISGGFPIANQFPDWFVKLGTGKLVLWGVGIPVPAIILLIFFILFQFIMTSTTTGRSIYAVGGNAEAARLSGVNVLKTKIIAFVSVQVMCIISGFINSAQVLSGSYSFGRGWEIDVIAAVVIGGTSMAGGVGKVWGTMIGIIFLGVIVNGMTILNVDQYAQYVVRAALVFFAVLIATYQTRAKK